MAKSLSLMRELIPTASTIAVLINPANAVQSENEIRDAEAAARILGVRVVVLRASRPGDIELAFAQLASKSADALVVDGENLFSYATRFDRCNGGPPRYPHDVPGP
jgi:putative ABC transport system substrate-binding protein